METEIARHHQIHGLQAVLPVPDVSAAVQWFGNVLGFQLDFALGEPPGYARVHLGDRSFGDPVYLHLRLRADSDDRAHSELRLHAGADLDRLHAHAVAAGAEVVQAPTDQPWGLREFALRAPGGHAIIVGAEIAAADASAAGSGAGGPRTVVVAYRPKPGQHAALLTELRRHVPTLQRLGLASVRAPFVMQAQDGVLLEVFEWAGAEAIGRAHHEPEVRDMWERIGKLCSIERLSTLPESTQMFAEFQAL